MSNYAEYVVKETSSNLWRNRVTTIAAVVTVMISLFLVGASLVLRQGASNAEVQWHRGTQVRVWMSPAATPQEIAAVKVELSQAPYVTDCGYRTQLDNYQEAQHLLPPSVFNVLKVSKVPSSFNCTPLTGPDAAVVYNEFIGRPGVFNVTAPFATLRNDQRYIEIAQWAVLVVALLLLISSAVLILNTIRMAILARRREVAVMKLVGATNWFIRIPFIFEGLIQGLLGSLLATGLIIGGEELWRTLADPNNPQAIGYQMLLSNWQLLWTVVIVVVVGVAIGSIGSAIAIRRFLDV